MCRIPQDKNGSEMAGGVEQKVWAAYLTLKFLRSQSNLDSMASAKETNLIHGDSTAHHIRLRGSSAKILVPDTQYTFWRLVPRQIRALLAAKKGPIHW